MARFWRVFTGLLLSAFVDHALGAQQQPDGVAQRVFHATREGLREAGYPERALVFGFEDRGVRYAIEVDKGKVVGRAGAELLAPARLRVEPHRIDVLDEGGLLMARIATTTDGGSLRTYPARSRVALGLRLLPASRANVAANGHRESTSRLVAEVTAGSAAAKAGVRPGDLWVEVDGGAADDARLRSVLATKQPGDRMAVRLLRGATEVSCDVLLQPAPAIQSEVQPSSIELRDGAMLVFRAPAYRSDPADWPQSRGEVQELTKRMRSHEALIHRLPPRSK